MISRYDRMTPRQRVMAAANNQDFDCYPAICPTSVANYDCMRIASVSFPQAHTDGYAMAALAATAHTVLGFDSVMPYFSIHLEAEMLGCQVSWNQEHGMPQILKNPLHKITDFRPPKNFTSKPLCRQLLTAIRLLKKRFGNEVAIIGKVLGPWTLAYNLYGVENLILDTILEPEQVHTLIRQLLPISIEFAKAQFQAGADLITWADHVTADLISARQYEEFIFPLHKQATSRLFGGKNLILHTCGNVMDRLDLIRQTGFGMFHIDSRNDLPVASRIGGKALTLTGSINNPVTLVNGDPILIKKEVLHNIQSGIRLISPECAIPFKVSNKSLIALVNAAHNTPVSVH